MIRTAIFRQTGKWLAGAVVLASLGACGGDSGGGGQADSCDTFDCVGMLDNLGNNVIGPTFVSLEGEATAFEQAAVDYEAAVGAADEADRKADLQAQWRDTMAVMQQVEVMQVGPLASDNEGLRDTLYSWPASNTCGVDQDVIFAEDGQLPNGDPYEIDGRTVDRRGLDALEYILFTDSLEHTCASTVSATEDWNSRPEEERIAARAGYIRIAAGDIVNQAERVLALWDGSEGDFLAELTDPESDTSRFSDAQDAVNAVSDALFYVEKQAKDVKLAQPLGLIDNSCGGDPCPEDVESPFSANSRDNIRHNLAAFQRLFLGGEPGPGEGGLGFDDYLEALGEENIATVMGTDIEDAILSVSDDRFPGTLKDALDNDISSVEGAHDATKKVTDRLKNEFISVLGLSIPDSVGGDTD